MIGIIGLGYVGLPLSATLAEADFQVIGFDTDIEKINLINAGESYIFDLPTKKLDKLIKLGKMHATSDMQSLSNLDIICICVPTPLSKTKTPDVSYIISATESIGRYLRRDQLIILESTTYPGTTKEIVQPLLEESGLKVGLDFFLAFSPERIDPGNVDYNTVNTPKVVGGITKSCVEMASVFYRQFVDKVYQVSSATTAESVKLLENTFRAVNIALVNEFAQMCDKMGLDVWEIIDAAATKPFGYMPFYPGPGLGGHCIPVDPHYLAWKFRLHNHPPRFIDLASEINSAVPSYIVQKITHLLNQDQLAINGSSVFVIGVSYKPDVEDTRESPAIEIINQLITLGACITYHDPFVSEVEVVGERYQSVHLTSEQLDLADCIVILTNHSVIDYDQIEKYKSKVIDTRNSFGKTKLKQC